MHSESGGVSFYVHIPFCAQRCSYCDFFFVTSTRGYEQFVDALCKEISQLAHSYPDHSLTTIYLGGGTPSRVSPQSIHQILQEIYHCFDTQQVREITLEANPEDISAPRLEQYLDCGVTRISLGVQSFSNVDLKVMNRCHNSTEAKDACTLIGAAGFQSWSLDLIFGIPEASLLDWEENLVIAMETGAPHISSYSLTVEPQTVLHKQVQRGVVNPVSDSMISEQFQKAIDMLTDADYEHYEISSFAHSGHRSLHNSRYWSHQNYLGVGPSAHSFLWDDEKIKRWKNTSNLRIYQALISEGKSPVTSSESLAKRDVIRERIMLALRTLEGVDLEDLQKRYGYNLAQQRQDKIFTMELNGLINYNEKFISLTDRGKHICDQITQQLWPE